MGYTKWRLISTLVAVLIYSFMLFPIPSIVISVVLIFCYILFTHFSKRHAVQTGDALRRRAALDTAKIYLAPYDNIWRNLKLSNKFCSIRLGADGMTITARESGKELSSYRTFKIVSSKVHTMPDLWDMFCINFSHNKTYDGLVEDCRLYKTVISESTIQIDSFNSNNINKPVKALEKLDVNNASEVELTALPGISIVMSKKIIKKREEICGFKNIDEFFVFLKLKPHMEAQLRNMVCADKMKGSLKIERYNERSVDL